MSRTNAGLGITLVAMLVVAVLASPVPQQANTPLKDMSDLIVGQWTGEGIFAADFPGYGKKGEKFTTAYTCRWIAGQAAISCEGGTNKNTWIRLYW